MPLPDVWIDDLFKRLAVRYGQAFLRQYDGLNLSEVKRDWAMVLESMNGDRLRYAMHNLPEAAPTALTFRKVCMEYNPPPAPPPRLIAGPPPDPDRKEAVRRMLKELRQRITGEVRP